MEHEAAPVGGDKNTGPEQMALHSLSAFIALVLVSLRFYVRARIVKKIWWDDFFLLLGMLLSISLLGMDVAKVKSGYGRHVYYLSTEQIPLAAKLEVLGTPLVVLCTMFTKISICLMLLRIFATNRARKKALYIIMALIVATNVSSAIIILPQCKPAAKLWNPTIQGTCWPRETQIAIAYYQGGISIFTDFLLALLPIHFLKDIQISFRTKLSICGLMSLGVFTGICAIIRTALLNELKSSDVTYSSTNLDIWATLEKDVAIIATAAAALRPLWAKSANQKTSGQARRPDDKQNLTPTCVVTDQQTAVDSLLGHLETRITAQGGKNHGDDGNEATSLPDYNGIVKTSDVNMETFRKIGGRWIPEHSSPCDTERSVEDVV